MLFAMQVQSITCARRITMDWIGLDGALSTDRGNTKDIRRRERDSGNDRTIIYHCHQAVRLCCASFILYICQ